MPDSIRIVHVTTVPESLGFLDGQLEYLRARGFEFVAISSPGPALAEFGAQQSIETIAVEMPREITPLADVRALAQLVRELRRIRPVIVHAHTPKGGLLGTLAAVLAGVPCRIYHMRGLPLSTATGWKRTLLRWTERISCAAATKVICVGPSLRREALRERLSRPDKITVLANGSGQGVAATSKFNPDRLPANVRESTRERYGIPRDAFVIGFLGRLVRDKGFVELAEAFESLAREHANVHLIVAGSREKRDSVPEPTLRMLEDHPRVHFIGFERDTPSLYAALDLVVVPTYREGFPNVPLEAAAMRKPVIASRVVGCIDAVVDGETGLLIPARDSVALAEAIAIYVSAPELGRRHGDAGRNRVLARFTREAIWDALHAEYVGLVYSPRSTYALLKRALDLSIAITALGILAVPMAGLAIAIAINMGRPVIFAHVRPGKDEKLFRLYKFRTMTDARAASGELLPDGARITRLGAWMRRTSVDELPELLNVLKGDMSLVGPRPLLVRYLPHYTDRERLRHSVLPGITGWAQVHGRNEVSWDDRLAHDVSYVLRRSLLLDLEILVSTFRLVVRREGVVVDPRSTMLNFDEERIQRVGPAPIRGEDRRG